MEALSSMCNLRILHAVVRRDPVNMGKISPFNKDKFDAAWCLYLIIIYIVYFLKDRTKVA
jgi:hypothetical protein